MFVVCRKALGNSSIMQCNPYRFRNRCGTHTYTDCGYVYHPQSHIPYSLILVEYEEPFSLVAVRVVLLTVLLPDSASASADWSSAVVRGCLARERRWLSSSTYTCTEKLEQLKAYTAGMESYTLFCSVNLQFRE